MNERPLVFVAVDRYGRIVDVVPVEGDRWAEAEAWCYLARRMAELTPPAARAAKI